MYTMYYLIINKVELRIKCSGNSGSNVTTLEFKDNRIELMDMIDSWGIHAAQEKCTFV